MLIHVSNKPSRVPLNLCKQAVEFYGKLLLGNLFNKIEVTISFEKKLGAMAFCLWEDNHRYGREFTIQIDKNLSKREMLHTLAHEMVHLKQYARGELKDYIKDDNKTLWKNKLVIVDQVCYWDQEWEIEANGREHGLYVRFMEHMRSIK